MRTVYTAAKSSVSIRKIRSLLDLQRYHGTDMGENCDNSVTFKNMLQSIGLSLHTRLTHWINSAEGPLSIILGITSNPTFVKVT